MLYAKVGGESEEGERVKRRDKGGDNGEGMREEGDRDR